MKLMIEEEYDKLTKLIHMQLSKYGVKRDEYDDYVQEVWLYIYNRKGLVNIDDPYIYGDIKNGIINYRKKDKKHLHCELTENVLHVRYHTDNGVVDLFELEDLVLDYEYGYLFIDHYISDLSVVELSDKYNISTNKIYYELNKIKNKINWVNK